ncbi:hypothetical protein K402DRAFT_116024 [Aulographum hederae CBS 113979]|uniref:Uncharacterized protein n=1 Tax=Aulographum hederae CBS 113979 TaxID=1176131 RepID=A0A6G1GVL8_9PEZI|nr:hypothetical protein K402DRAFT_116024 [Aulographum hederae CBS 113979]
MWLGSCLLTSLQRISFTQYSIFFFSCSRRSTAFTNLSYYFPTDTLLYTHLVLLLLSLPSRAGGAQWSHLARPAFKYFLQPPVNSISRSNCVVRGKLAVWRWLE